MLSFRRLGREDFPLLAEWLAEPHVARWWNHETSAEAVERDFGPTVDGLDPSEDFIALDDGRPVGFIQRCQLRDFPEYLEELGKVIAVPDESMTIDYLVGRPEELARGLGTRMTRAFVDDLWACYPKVKCVIVPVAAANVASWRVLEKAGFTRIASGELTPDNPVDDQLHFVYEIRRA